MASVRAAIEHGLPDEFRGWPTQFGWDDVPVTHHVETVPFRDWWCSGSGSTRMSESLSRTG